MLILGVVAPPPVPGSEVARALSGGRGCLGQHPSSAARFGHAGSRSRRLTRSPAHIPVLSEAKHHLTLGQTRFRGRDHTQHITPCSRETSFTRDVLGETPPGRGWSPVVAGGVAARPGMLLAPACSPQQPSSADRDSAGRRCRLLGAREGAEGLARTCLLSMVAGDGSRPLSLTASSSLMSAPARLPFPPWRSGWGSAPGIGLLHATRPAQRRPGALLVSEGSEAARSGGVGGRGGGSLLSPAGQSASPSGCP